MSESFYIPKNLEDCFIQLDKILSEEDKNFIKKLGNRNETFTLHFTLGLWIRNNWIYRKDSRLSSYFSNKVIHEDDISGIIIQFYYDWLNNNNEEWQEWINNKNKSWNSYRI